MFKRFLEIFRNENDPPTEDMEHPHQDAIDDDEDRTYLAFLFESVLPRVEKRLEEHPQSDPILEVAVALLVELFPDRWEEPKAALRDEFSPAGGPPAPPPGTGPPEEQDDDESEQDDEPLADTAEIIDVDDLGVTEEGHHDGEGAAPSGFVSALDETAEFAPPDLADVSTASPWPMALDDPAVLRGARVLLAVLLDNDRLPESKQLEVAEVVMAAELWVHLMARAVDINEKVQNLARLVERKFEANHFSQARLLLKLFPANRPTQVNNDRQLFFEEMIYRLGIRRGGLGGEKQTLAASLASLELSDDEAVRSKFQDLATGPGIEMFVYTREPDEVVRWRELVEGCSNEVAAQEFLERIPPRRWRRVMEEGDRKVATSLREHIVRPMAREEVIGYIKTCYFVLRAVGDTGLEGYLNAFFDWSQSCCDVEATVYLPEVHRRVQEGQELIDEVFGEIYDDYYGAVIGDKLDAFDEAAMEEAFVEAMDRIAEVDVADVPTGQFNLGALVLDAHLGFEYPEPAFAFKLHRLT